VFLRADRLLAYGEVLRVMDQIRVAGITRISLVTVPIDDGSARR
jgi:biopolymer transport protein ExbD